MSPGCRVSREQRSFPGDWPSYGPRARWISGFRGSPYLRTEGPLKDPSTGRPSSCITPDSEGRNLLCWPRHGDRSRMKSRAMVRLVVGTFAALLVSSGCTTIRQITGYGLQGDPSVSIRPTETRWLLIKNPRFG